MNLSLILTTIVTSAADSVNPVAITQQFVLQGMVKKRSHILWFILATYITNFCCGLMVYYGLLEFISILAERMIRAAGSLFFLAELGLGAGIILFGIHRLTGCRLEKAKSAPAAKEKDEAQARAKIRSVSPLSLYLLGTGATLMELSSALPYFAFLGVLVQYRLSLAGVLFIQAVYNLFYALPLFLLYGIYCWKQSLFDQVYRWVKRRMEKLEAYVAPALLTAIGCVLAIHGCLHFIR